MLEETEAPIEFVDGFIQELAVTVPWSNLLKDNCFFEIRGLTVTCQVKKRAHPSQLSASIFHSMCESFSSKDVAEECLRQKDLIDEENGGKNKAGSTEEIPTTSAAADEMVLGKFIHSFIYSFVHSFVHSFIHSSIHSLIDSFIHSLIH